MATRTTENEVKQIIDTDLTVSEVTPFLRTANLIVTEILANEDYSTDRMREIELWLSAHLIAVRDPRASQEKIGEGDVKYHGQSGMGLQHTPYGQQVMLLDDHGRLAQASAAKRPFEIKVLG